MEIRTATAFDAAQLTDLLQTWNGHPEHARGYRQDGAPTGPGTHVAAENGSVIGWLHGEHSSHA